MKRRRAARFSSGGGRFPLPLPPTMAPLAGLGLLLLLAYGVLTVRRGDGRMEMPAGVNQPTAAGSLLVVVEVAAEGDFRVDGSPVSEEELAARLRAALLPTVEPREWGALLRVDRRTEYARVAAVVAACRDAGFGRVAFATETRSGTGGADGK